MELGRRRKVRERGEVGLVRGVIAETRVRTSGVVEGEVASDARRRGGDRLVAVQVHLFVLERAPEPFDERQLTPREDHLS